MTWQQGRFTNRSVLVTGASSGIGRATAQRLLDEGATVVGADVAQQPDLRPSAAGAETGTHAPVDSQEGAGRFVFVQTDVCDDEAAVEAVTTAVELTGRLDGLFHAAAVTGSRPLHLLDRAEWERLVTNNLTGTFVTTKAVLAQMLVQEPIGGERGSIVTLGRTEAAGSSSGYGASKAGAALITRGLAVDYGSRGVRANVLCPGHVEHRDIPDGAAVGDSLGTYRAAHPLGRLAQPDEIAAAAAFLLSPDASFRHRDHFRGGRRPPSLARPVQPPRLDRRGSSSATGSSESRRVH